MRKFLTFSILILSCFSLTSCLDIFENVLIHKDGSGKYSLTLGISEKVKQNMAQSIDSELNNVKKPTDSEDSVESLGQDEQYKASLEQIVENLKKVKGITNVKMVYDEIKFQYGYEYEFADLQALNNAMESNAGTYIPALPGNVQLGKKKKVYASQSNYIEEIKNTIIRHQSADLGKILEMKKPGGNNSGMMGGIDIKYILQDLTYKTTFQFDQTIKKVSNEAAVISKDEKSFTINCQPFAYQNLDKDQLLMHAEACNQNLQIDFK